MLKWGVIEVGKALGGEVIGEKGSGGRKGKCRGVREKRGRERYAMIRRLYYCELSFICPNRHEMLQLQSSSDSWGCAVVTCASYVLWQKAIAHDNERLKNG